MRCIVLFASQVLVANKITLKPGFQYHYCLKTIISLRHRRNNTRKKLSAFYIIYIEVIFVADSILRDKAKVFAKEIIFLCREMKSNIKESVLINQILRSATSIGANIHEAQYAQGTKDFISKLEIAQKECYETEYWLELLFETDCITEEKYKKLHNDCGAIRRMLIASLKTVKSNKM